MQQMQSTDPGSVPPQGRAENMARKVFEVRDLRRSADWKLFRAKKLVLLQERLPPVSL